MGSVSWRVARETRSKAGSDTLKLVKAMNGTLVPVGWGD
jgi:hypothetical protein